MGTPPHSPLSARSLPVSLVCTQREPTRQRTYKILENLEMIDLDPNPKKKDRKGER
jgi:hypothetical protein